MLEEKGVLPQEADRRAGYRVFGSKPGAYGAGLQTLIDERIWDGDGDLADAYLGWSGYAYIAHLLTAVEQTAQLREQELRKELAKAASDAEAKRKEEDAERERLAALRAEKEGQEKAAAEAAAEPAAPRTRRSRVAVAEEGARGR